MKQQRDYSQASEDPEQGDVDYYNKPKAPGTLLGLRKVKRFFNLNKKDGALSS